MGISNKPITDHSQIQPWARPKKLASSLRQEWIKPHNSSSISCFFPQVSAPWDCNGHLFIMKLLLFKLTTDNTCFGELAFI